MLLGNANELVSQTRRCNILQCVDKSLVKYGKDSAAKNQESLFGPDFCSQLKNQVESVKTFSQVVSLAHRYHPYEKSQETTLGRSKKQFFSAGLCRQIWVPTGPYLSPKEAASPEANSSPEESQQLGQITKIFPPPPPNNAFQILQLDMTPITRHVSSPVGGRTAQFVENWMKLSQDPWIHSTITGYQLPLQCWPKRNHSTAEDKRLILQSKIHKLVKKVLFNHKAITCLPNKLHVCGPQKRRRLEANHRSEILQFLPGATILQGGGSLYVTKDYKFRVVLGKD